jgi:hypothetical protein
MTVLRRSARALIGATICIVVGVPIAVILLVGVAVTVQMIVWWFG